MRLEKWGVQDAVEWKGTENCFASTDIIGRANLEPSDVLGEVVELVSSEIRRRGRDFEWD